MHCGKPTEEGKLVCPNCERPQRSPAVTGQESAPATEPVLSSQEITFQQNAPIPGPGKNRKRGIIAAIIACVPAVALVVTAVLCWGSIQSFFIRTFGTPQEYMQHVEGKALNAAIDALTASYAAAQKQPESMGYRSEMHLLLGDEFLEGFSQGLVPNGQRPDLSWLSDIALHVSTYQDGSSTQVDMGIGLADSSIATLRVLMDMADSSYLLGIPEMSDSYIHIDTSAASNISAEQFQRQQEATEALQQKLPGEKALNKLLKKYVKIVLSHIDNVQVSTESVTVDDIEQKLNVISSTIYEEEIYDILIDILQTALEDPEMMELLIAYCEYYYATNPVNYEYAWNEELGYYEMIPVYEDVDDEKVLTDGIYDLLNQLESQRNRADDENYIVLTTYADYSDNICGRELKVSGVDETLRYITVRKGSTFKTEVQIDTLKVTGTSTIARKMLSGEYVFYADDMKLGEITLSDFDFTKIKDSSIRGTVRLVFSQELMDQILYEMDLDGLIIAKDLSLVLEFDCTKDKTNTDIRFQENGELMLGMTVSHEIIKDGQITVPENTVDGTNEEALLRWLQDLDWDHLRQALDDAGVPKEYINALGELIDSLYAA